MHIYNFYHRRSKLGKFFVLFWSLCVVGGFVFYVFHTDFIPGDKGSSSSSVSKEQVSKVDSVPVVVVLDTERYDKKMLALANYSSTIATTTKRIWPATAAYPNVGAILPSFRIVAYYGNLYSKGMGVLGEYPEEEMLKKLGAEVKRWEIADPATPVRPALHYIAITAQDNPGKDGKYRIRMPDDQIDEVLRMAEKINALVFLDIQVGKSNVETEVPIYEKYLKMPNVHFGIDPEFSMKTGKRPGTVIGTMDAADINYVAEYLASLVREYNLPPKVLIVHRFTEDMVTNYRQITPLPEVQIVVAMDGWGPPAKKFGTYNHVIYPEPVQFTGFKLFYKNDLRPPSTHMLTPEEVLTLKPQPMYIQYQ